MIYTKENILLFRGQAMKRFLCLLLIIGVVIFLGGCNTPTDNTGTGEEVDDVDLTFGDENGQLFELQGDGDYPGCEITLTGDILDISKYAQVIVDATLYSDEAGTTKTVQSGTQNLAQFKLLKAGGGANWADPDNNVCANNTTKYNMKAEGETALDIPSGSSGIPTVLLIQANWEDFPEAVKSVKVRKVSFIAKKAGETTIEDGGLYVMDNSDNYPGAEVDLTKFAEGLKDISEYLSVTVNATLYTDEEGETVATSPTNPSDNLAQFKLLKATGGWDDDDNICSNTKYNMVVDGRNTLTIAAGNTGVPTVLLLQANWEDFTDDGKKIKSIKINTITFTPRPPTGTVILRELYDKGSFMDVEINSITFNNAMYSDCAALFAFPADWGAESENSLQGKTITFNYTIDPSHTCVPAGGTPPAGTIIEHQIHIQAAHDDSSEDKYNGNDGKPGQVYIELDNGSGSFTVPANDLIAAAGATNNSAGNGPFVLNAVRIVNNGTKWDESKDGGTISHYRCMSYTLVFTSITK